MNDFMVGFAFCASIAALVLAWRAKRKIDSVFSIIENRATRTVTVNTDDGKITIIKEFKNNVVDVK
jgi:poly(3-hydroxybutyrate) depolymerase